MERIRLKAIAPTIPPLWINRERNLSYFFKQLLTKIHNTKAHQNKMVISSIRIGSFLWSCVRGIWNCKREGLTIQPCTTHDEVCRSLETNRKFPQIAGWQRRGGVTFSLSQPICVIEGNRMEYYYRIYLDKIIFTILSELSRSTRGIICESYISWVHIPVFRQ